MYVEGNKGRKRPKKMWGVGASNQDVRFELSGSIGLVWPTTNSCERRRWRRRKKKKKYNAKLSEKFTFWTIFCNI